MSHTRILIVHPDPSVASLMTSMLQTLGHKIEEAPNDRAAVRRLELSTIDLVLAAADPRDPEALEFLTYVRRKHPAVPVILLFPDSHSERTREAMARGATAILRYPLPANSLRAAVAQALGQPELSAVKPPASPGNGASRTNGHALHEASRVPPPPRVEVAPPPFESSPPAPDSARPEEPMGKDPAFRQAVELAGAIASTAAPILLCGERGTGKTRLAHWIHRRGRPADAPIVEVSCGPARDSVLEVELFGRIGTGPDDPDRPGLIERARGGTLVLDEVSALSLPLQGRLLRLLRDGEFEPIGSASPEKAAVRIVLTTREDLSGPLAEGRFRADLYSQMAVVALKLPPLRLRGGDIETLAEAFRERFAFSLRKDISGFAPEALDRLRAHLWPGNIQELEQAIERAVVVARGTRIEANHLPLVAREAPASRPPARGRKSQASLGILPLKEALEVPEKHLILQALEALEWNRQETARVLDINRTTLYKKMKKYGLLFDEPVWAN